MTTATLTTAPPQITAHENDVALHILFLFNTREPLPQKVTLTLPVGPGAQHVSTSQDAAAIRTEADDSWTATGTVGSDTYTVTLTPKDNNSPRATTLSLYHVSTNGTEGTAPLAVVVDGTSLPALNLVKGPDKFTFDNFAPLTSQIPYGEAARLTWTATQVTDAGFTLKRSDGGEPLSLGSNVRSCRVENITKDTSFILTAGAKDGSKDLPTRVTVDPQSETYTDLTVTGKFLLEGTKAVTHRYCGEIVLTAPADGYYEITAAYLKRFLGRFPITHDTKTPHHKFTITHPNGHTATYERNTLKAFRMFTPARTKITLTPLDAPSKQEWFTVKPGFTVTWTGKTPETALPPLTDTNQFKYEKVGWRFFSDHMPLHTSESYTWWATAFMVADNKLAVRAVFKINGKVSAVSRDFDLKESHMERWVTFARHEEKLVVRLGRDEPSIHIAPDGTYSLEEPVPTNQGPLFECFSDRGGADTYMTGIGYDENAFDRAKMPYDENAVVLQKFEHKDTGDTGRYSGPYSWGKLDWTSGKSITVLEAEGHSWTIDKDGLHGQAPSS
ncbi:hypothetical protein [Streptomyces sp. S186]|uniref:hypothetical protein n=1 Tax=Streptomyces sp. S186 TaxID=3434395 RepID=UPI003F6793AC